jgi:hypothetical protein
MDIVTITSTAFPTIPSDVFPFSNASFTFP